jgi:hypothetical protein
MVSALFRVSIAWPKTAVVIDLPFKAAGLYMFDEHVRGWVCPCKGRLKQRMCICSMRYRHIRAFRQFSTLSSI